MGVSRSWTCVTVATAMAGYLAACTGDTIVFPGDDDGNDNVRNVTLKGNLDQVAPVTSRDIVVFAYNVSDQAYSCPCPGDSSASLNGKAAIVPAGETEFTITGLDNGPIAVMFLLDNAGNNADGVINLGDPVAILDDEDCELDGDVDGNTTVTLKDIDVFFDTAIHTDCQVSNPPGLGRARADLITQERNSPSN